MTTHGHEGNTTLGVVVEEPRHSSDSPSAPVSPIFAGLKILGQQISVGPDVAGYIVTTAALVSPVLVGSFEYLTTGHFIDGAAKGLAWGFRGSMGILIGSGIGHGLGNAAEVVVEKIGSTLFRRAGGLTLSTFTVLSPRMLKERLRGVNRVVKTSDYRFSGLRTLGTVTGAAAFTAVFLQQGTPFEVSAKYVAQQTANAAKDAWQATVNKKNDLLDKTDGWWHQFTGGKHTDLNLDLLGAPVPAGRRLVLAPLPQAKIG